MTQGSTRTVRREACNPPWYTRLWATTVRAELYRYSDLFVYDASNIRLSNISLAYRVPAHWCKKISLSGARLQFNVENVATFAFDSKANYDLGGKVKPNYVWGLYLNF